MWVRARLRLPRRIARQAEPAVARGPSCTGVRAPSETPVAGRLDGAPHSSCTASGRWHDGLERAGYWSRVSAGLRGRHTRRPASPATPGVRADYAPARREGDVVRHATSLLAEGTHPHALPLPHPVQQGVARDTAGLRTGDAMAIKFFGSLRSAWRSQGPRRAPGKSVRSLWVVLSKPAVRTPRTRYDGSCWDAAR
jgi:hypothetical protein